MLSLRCHSLRFTLWIWALFNRVNRSLFDVPFTFWSNPFEIPESGLVCMYELWGNLAQFVWATHTRAEVWTLRSDWRSRRYAIGSQGQIYKVNRNMKFYYFKMCLPRLSLSFTCPCWTSAYSYVRLLLYDSQKLFSLCASVRSRWLLHGFWVYR